MASACFSSVVGALIMTPLDVVKTRLQFQQKNSVNASTAYKGTLDAFLRIPKTEGVKALWKGLSPTLLMSVPSTVIYLTIYEALKDACGYSSTSQEKFNYVVPVVAGSIARSIAAVATCPFEYMRTFLQANNTAKADQLRQLFTLQRQKELAGAVERLPISKRIYAAPYAAARALNTTVRTLFTGLGITVMRDGPYAAIYWLGYEYLKRESNMVVSRTFGEANPLSTSQTFALDLACGLTAGTLASSLTNPIDVVKTKIQAKSPTAAATKTNNTISLVVREIMSSEGWKGFLKGMGARVIRVGPNTALTVSMFQLFKNFMPGSESNTVSSSSSEKQ